MGVAVHQAWSESQWTVFMGYLTISTNVDAIKHITDDNFSFRKTAHWCTVRAKNTVQLLQRSRVIHHLSEKCDFRVSPFYQVVQKHKLFEVKHILIAYFIGNIAVKKNIKICSCVSKL